VAVVQLFAAEIFQWATLARIMAAMGSLHDACFSAAFAEPHSCGVNQSSVPPLRREQKYKCARDEKLEQRTGNSCLRCGTHELAARFEMQQTLCMWTDVLVHVKKFCGSYFASHGRLSMSPLWTFLASS
jgi:hypothetical protein